MIKYFGKRSFLHFLLLLGLNILAISAQTTPSPSYTVTAYSMDNLRCLNENKDVLFKKGDLIVLCLHFVPTSSNGNPQRLAFEIKVDDYSALQVKGSYDLFKGLTSNTLLAMQASHNFSTSYPVVNSK